MWADLAGVANIVAIKESSENTRRIVDVQREYGDRFIVFAGVDDIVLESLMLGAQGWVSGLTNAFPRESVALFALAQAGRYAEARELYRWFMPLLHLDTVPTLVQCIKLAEQLLGRGSEMTRTPRLRLEGEERAHVERVVNRRSPAGRNSRRIWAKATREVIRDTGRGWFHSRRAAGSACGLHARCGSDNARTAAFSHRERRAIHVRARHPCTGAASR